jgi:predicted RNA-binding Zn-ribbon protein involved in translation (DUF1610 family)
MLIWLLVLAVIGAAAFAVYRFLKAQAPRAEPYFRFLCPHCGRKLHYRAHKAGREGLCPRCKRRCTFPIVPHGQW